MTDQKLPQTPQPDVVPEHIAVAAPSLWIYGSLLSLAVILIGLAFRTKVDWPGLFISLAASLIAAVVVLVLIGRYLGKNPDPAAAIARRVARWPPVRRLERAHQAWFGGIASRLGTGGAVAVHVTGGILLLLIVAYGLAWTVGAMISSSGLPLVDQPIMRWVVTQRTAPMIHNARELLSLLRGQPLVILVSLVALAVNWRSRLWHADVVGALDTVGAFAPAGNRDGIAPPKTSYLLTGYSPRPLWLPRARMLASCFRGGPLALGYRLDGGFGRGAAGRCESGLPGLELAKPEHCVDTSG
jgi:hypothetical protein